MQTTHFMLVPDRYAARHLRRLVSAHGARLGLVVGTFNELLEYARSACFLAPADDQWSKKFVECALDFTDAFWSASLKSYPRETASALESTLTSLLEGCYPKAFSDRLLLDGLSGLGKQHAADLVRLHQAMGESLPPALATAARLIELSTPPALTRLCVFCHTSLQELKPWQRLLIERLNRDSAGRELAELAALMLDVGKAFLPSETNSAGNIGQLGSKLFIPGAARQQPDGSLQWIAVRDYLEEAEIVAGQVQTLLRQASQVNFAEVALLLPANPNYAMAVTDLFTRAGIPLSGSAGESSRRDLGREVLFHFLMVMQKPAATMAWAALLTSPFMPWSARKGHQLAQKFADGHFATDDLSFDNGSGPAMLELLRRNMRNAPAKQLLDTLKEFSALLVLDADQELCAASESFRACLGRCQDRLAAQSRIDWEELRSITTPELLRKEHQDTPIREGVALFHEGGEPWRTVKHLFVLGFNDGHYPQEPAPSSIFTDRDLQALNHDNGVDVETREEVTTSNRRLLRRQLSSATETVTFLFSRKSPAGETLQPSATLPFIASLFKGGGEAEQVILEIDREDDRKQMRWLAETAPRQPVAPRILEIADLELGTDLLGLWPKSDGSLREQSPSRLANLMTSPLGWLFGWLDLSPREWVPESMDPATKGTLAHEVFEHLFLAEQPLPTPAQIMDKVHDLLHRAILNNVPFLLTDEWTVERNHLEGDILKAALRWQELLESTGLRVVGNEIKLYGILDGVPLKGFADIILSLPDGRIIVGDYKKSKSGSRKKQMESGYDSQASLYRIMLEMGRISSKQEMSLPDGLRSDRIGVLYYTLNDQVVLTDTVDWLPRQADIKELGSGIADAAMNALKVRFGEVRQGQVKLNYTDDEKCWDKLGIKLYCLDDSPLLRIFMHERELSS